MCLLLLLLRVLASIAQAVQGGVVVHDVGGLRTMFKSSKETLKKLVLRKAEIETLLEEIIRYVIEAQCDGMNMGLEL